MFGVVLCAGGRTSTESTSRVHVLGVFSVDTLTVLSDSFLRRNNSLLEEARVHMHGDHAWRDVVAVFT